MLARIGVLVVALALLAGGAGAQDKPKSLQKAEPEVKRLLQLMDTDKNGKVSRDEFMSFMSAEFDRLDVNHDGQLDVKELAGLRVTPTKHPGGGTK
jgi:hypothetical protein